jgi:hypothetical protein
LISSGSGNSILGQRKRVSKNKIKIGCEITCRQTQKRLCKIISVCPMYVQVCTLLFLYVLHKD